MPIEVGIWRLGDKVQKVGFSSLDAESTLEDTLVADLSILSPQLMLIGRQVATATGKFIDLLAMDAEGDLVVIELKRNRTPRDVVAQTLDYASWVQDLSYDEIKEVYAEKNDGKELEEGFDEAFGTSLPEELNQKHRLIVVASELDSSSERIIDYLGDNYGVPINAVFFESVATILGIGSDMLRVLLYFSRTHLAKEGGYVGTGRIRGGSHRRDYAC